MVFKFDGITLPGGGYVFELSVDESPLARQGFRVGLRHVGGGRLMGLRTGFEAGTPPPTRTAGGEAKLEIIGPRPPVRGL